MWKKNIEKRGEMAYNAPWLSILDNRAHIDIQDKTSQMAIKIARSVEYDWNKLGMTAKFLLKDCYEKVVKSAEIQKMAKDGWKRMHLILKRIIDEDGKGNYKRGM